MKGFKLKQKFGKIWGSMFCMNCKSTFYFFLFIIIITGSTTNSYASGDGGIEQKVLGTPITGNTNGIYISGLQSYSSISLTDNATSIASYNRGSAVSENIKNIISLNIKEDALIPVDFIATVRVKIQYGKDANNLTTIPEQELTVDYKRGQGAKYNTKNYYSFEKAAYVIITVNSTTITPSQTGNFNVTNVLVLLNEIRATQYFNLDNTIKPTFATPSNIITDELNANWACNFNGGNGFQLEWAWLEDEMKPLYSVNDIVNTDKLFLNNSTRVELAANVYNYSIPLYYDGTGKLYYRIRSINYSQSGNRTDGDWVIADPFIFGGHNDNLNWQVRTSFAEEGKRKTVMEYFDGSLRSRQTVTKDNSTNTTVTAETFYDGQGRPAVQILPAPGINNIISYQANLNQFNGQADNSDPADFFDLQPASASQLTLNTASGSSLYYSAANPEKSVGINQYIPDAEGYPYTVTRYTPDGSGRIMAQSGVGDKTKIGSGRETKYYYGTPAQEELDGLFGTEVGYSSHYFKNMVQDANGQMSVSYVDMQGRTVATALAGEHPSNLNDLYPNAAYPSVTRNLLDNSSNLVKNNQNIESVNTLLVPASTIYNFSYSLTPGVLQAALPECTTATCFDCLYDLEISITDEMGETNPVVRKFNNLSITSAYNCNSNPLIAASTVPVSAVSGNVITFSETLTPGSYSVRKTLTISEFSLQTLKDELINKACWKTQDELIDSVFAVLKTVTKCDQPATAGATTNTSQVLATKRALMLADMMPFSGQYALNPNPDNPADPQVHGIVLGNTSYNKYDIFSTANNGVYSKPFYKYPRKENGTSAPPLDLYYDNDGQQDQTIYSNPTLLPNISAADFEQLFKDKWAESLLPYHPEYKKLIFAENNLGPSYDMINKFSRINTYAEAQSNGFIFTSASQLSDPDPAKGDLFYKLTDAASYKSTMETYITSNYRPVAAGKFASMWQLAYFYVKCKDQNCLDNQHKFPPFSDINTDAEKDQLWLAFKNIYQAERDAQVNQYIQDKQPLSDADATDLIGQNYILHFPKSNRQMADQFSHQGGDWGWYPAMPGGDPAIKPSPTSAIDSYASQCHSYVLMWKQSLLQCPALAGQYAIINEITTRMEEVCKNGSDAANPYGSSIVAPGKGPDVSFEDVIKNVFLSHNIDITNYCNPFVIEFPKPYGQNTKLYNDVTGTIDNCNCQQFQKFKDDAGHLGFSYEMFNSYLKSLGLDTLTYILYDALVNNCDKTTKRVCTKNGRIYYIPYECGAPRPVCPIDAEDPLVTSTTSIQQPPGDCSVPCQYYTCTTENVPFPLPSPQPMPDFLKCGFDIRKTCYTCAELSVLIQQFKTFFPSQFNSGPVFTGASISDDQIEINKSFARFVNFKTGMRYSWIDYAKKFNAADCNAANYTNNSNANQTVVCANTTPLTDTTGLFVTDDPCQATRNMAIAIGQQLYQSRVQSLLADFEDRYRTKCLSVQNNEAFTVTYSNKEYHYTLYYYDQAGNLVKTVPPKAVVTDYQTGYLTAVKTARDAGNVVLTPYSTALAANDNPSPLLATNYRYNSLNQVVQQNTPDAGLSAFWYDKVGRLSFSQNAQQKLDGKYSYTDYDNLGRIQEVGQKPQSVQMTQDISQDKNTELTPPTLAQWRSGGGTKEQLTLTVYDLAYQPFVGTSVIDQQNLRNRVSYSATKNLATDGSSNSGTYYSYDVHGNVDALLHDYSGIDAMTRNNGVNTANRYKKITYDYDLISGKVNRVNYQPGFADAFYHRYSYDAENRITTVETSRDDMMWERDAAYNYYKHGPLARTQLGQLNVQGIDYAYTLQGWLKGVNSTAISGAEGQGCPPGSAYDILSVSSRAQYNQPAQYTAKTEIDLLDGFESTEGDAFETFIDPSATACNPSGIPSPYTYGDMGQDGDGSPPGDNRLVARDAFGFSLNYYTGDYTPINAVTPFAAGMHDLPAAPSDGIAAAAELYNGNIASMMVSIPALSRAGGSGQMVYGYRYDQLNRIVNMNAYHGFDNQSNSFSPVAIDDYKERISYDPNGNIMGYTRNGTLAAGKPLAMDALTYNYTSGTNKLTQVTDAVNANNYIEDIDNQAAGNYTYDANGNMISDAASGISSIEWTVYGKIKSITKAGGTISYVYDAAGNRISKTVGTKTTVYVRDATGNVMAVYEALGGNVPTQAETHLYGSSRLGIMTPHYEPAPANTVGADYGTAKISTFTRGEKLFELSNHLGNVLATVSDKRMPFDDGYYEMQCYATYPPVPCTYEKLSGNPDGVIDYYTADVVTATDYYPGGMQMPGRKYNYNGAYRYGFNGKENDNEVKGEGNQQDYGMRGYDPRDGRFWSVDPITAKYPFLTPYQFASNSPISGVDLDGLEFYYTSDGSLLGKYGNSTRVMLVDNTVTAAQIKLANTGSYNINEINTHSKDVGLDNGELNMRAMLSTMKKYEGSKPGLKAYYTWNGGEMFKETNDHPGKNSKGNSAAGAYQILIASWTDKQTGKKFRLEYNITDFSPESQDKFAIATIKDKASVKSYDLIIDGNFSGAVKKMSNEWRFLPGPKSQSKVKPEEVLKSIKTAISNELNDKSDIATKKGQLLKDFK